MLVDLNTCMCADVCVCVKHGCRLTFMEVYTSIICACTVVSIHIQTVGVWMCHGGGGGELGCRTGS